MRRHNGVYQYSCDLCGKGCSSKNTLRGHMASVHNVGGVHCPVCNRYFSRKDNMMYHIRSRHGTEAAEKAVATVREIVPTYVMEEETQPGTDEKTDRQEGT